MMTAIDYDALPAEWHRGFYARINGDVYANCPYADVIDRAHWQTGYRTADNILNEHVEKHMRDVLST